MARKPIMASYWQWNPEDESDDPEVEGMDVAVAVERGDEDHVLLAVRGKVRGRYESTDSAWLELTDAEAVRLIERLAATINTPA